MKKIVLLFVLLFVLPGIVNAEMFYAGNQVKEVPIYLDKITKQSYRYFKTAYRKSDNSLVYCADPSKLLSTTDEYYYIVNDQEKALGISKDKWRRIELLAYFGYGYENHIDEKWKAITQYLIWQTVLPEGWFLTFTDGYEGEFKNVHEKETEEIESLITKFETKPSFQNETFKISKNNALVLKDNNNILNNYNLVSNTDLKVTIENNELKITGTKNGVYNLEFVRGKYYPTKLYLSNENQAVVSTDGSPENKFSITVIVESGNVTIKRKYNNYLDNESTIENAIYKIVDSEHNEQILATNKDGEIILKDLPIGELTIKELNPSIGYEKDENEYTIDVLNNNEIILEINPQLIIKKVNIIKKYLIEEENLLPNEVDSFFMVLKNNESKILEKTNDNGLVTFMIPYGNYVISQKSSVLNYELMKDYNIFIKNSQEETLTFINYKKKSSEDILKDESVSEENIIEKEETNIEFESNTRDEDLSDPITFDKDMIDNIPEVIPENPQTGDNLRKYLWLIISSGVILIKIIRKMQ